METFERLDTQTVSDVLKLVEIGTAADGLAAFGEATILNLRHGDRGDSRHILIRSGSGDLIGCASLALSDAEAADMEMLVHPLHRHRGHGAAMISRAEEIAREAGKTRLQVWAHGDHPTAVALGTHRDFDRHRVLWQMRRTLTDADRAATPAPDGVTIRTFSPGRDEQALLEVNNAAFADHPDQSGWTLRDVAMREREEWFDPAGLILAEDGDGTLLGFHWTKVHRDENTHVGEVYILGVHPRAQGMKLGKALTATGLAYLRGRDLDTVMLYVDESNTTAVSLYERSGFMRWTADVNYRKALLRECDDYGSRVSCHYARMEATTIKVNRKPWPAIPNSMSSRILSLHTIRHCVKTPRGWSAPTP